MPFLNFQNQVSSNDPYAVTGDMRIIVTHPNVSNFLILTELEEYNPNWENWLSIDQRTLEGSLSIAGLARNPTKTANINATVTELQLLLFEEIKRKIDYYSIPATITDRFRPVTYHPGIMTEPFWLSGYPVTNILGQSQGFIAINVFIDVDENYAVNLGGGLYTLNFQIKEI